MFFDSSVEFREELVNSCVGDFWEKASERKEVNSSLIEGVGQMSGVDVWDKASFVSKGKRVHMSIWETMQGGVVQPRVGGSGDGMVESRVEAWRGSMWGLKGGIRCGGRLIVCKGKLGAEKGGERGSKARGESSVEGGQNAFEEVKEGLDSGNRIRNICVEDVAMLAEARM